jgi:hypothetical protein
VRETKSSEGAKLAARFCSDRRDWRAAIEFLILSKAADEAFELATRHEEMAVFTAALGKDGTAGQYQAVASYYEAKGEFSTAGDFWQEASEPLKALRTYLQCGEREIDKAVQVVGRTRTDQLTHTLIDFLMGETDGVPKVRADAGGRARGGGQMGWQGGRGARRTRRARTPAARARGPDGRADSQAAACAYAPLARCCVPSRSLPLAPRMARALHACPSLPPSRGARARRTRITSSGSTWRSATTRRPPRPP